MNMARINERSGKNLKFEIEEVLALETYTIAVDAWNKNPIVEAISFRKLPDVLVKDYEGSAKDRNLDSDELRRVVAMRNQSVLMIVNGKELMVSSEVRAKLERILKSHISNA